MRDFPVELEYTVKPGDVLYIPPLWGHHGVAQDNECLTCSIGYRSLRASEILEALADWLNEQPQGGALFQDPNYSNSPQGLLDQTVCEAALQAIKPALTSPGLTDSLAQMVTLPDQAAVELLPEPLEPPLTVDDLQELLVVKSDWIRDSVTRMAITSEGKLFINGQLWKTDASHTFKHYLANHILYKDLEQFLASPTDTQALLEVINNQWMVPDED
jgi:50S ribosomal protein L16 3-hydroxylase